jgi:hypothetical protein
LKIRPPLVPFSLYLIVLFYGALVWKNAFTKWSVPGELDLSIAQRDIASDCIGAYKKYFHTDRPLSLRSGLTPAADDRRPVRD